MNVNSKARCVTDLYSGSVLIASRMSPSSVGGFARERSEEEVDGVTVCAGDGGLAPSRSCTTATNASAWCSDPSINEFCMDECVCVRERGSVKEKERDSYENNKENSQQQQQQQQKAYVGVCGDEDGHVAAASPRCGCALPCRLDMGDLEDARQSMPHTTHTHTHTCTHFTSRKGRMTVHSSGWSDAKQT